MATKQIIKPAKSPTAVGPYNHAVRVGDLLFCAGQIPIDPKDGNLIAGDIKAQTERVLENVKAILDDQKLTFANVVKSTVFLTDLTNFAGMNEIYAKYFTGDFPARSTIQVAAFVRARQTFYVRVLTNAATKMKPKKSWREKLADDKDLPKVGKVTGK